MRVECEACKDLAVASFAIDGQTVRATCAACGAVTTAVAVGAPAPAPAPRGPTCPKCGAGKVPDAVACAGCGLLAARMDTFVAERDATVPASVRAAWDAVITRWEDLALHDALFALVAEHGVYAWAAGRYRDEARARPDDVTASRQVERLRKATEATMFVTARPRTPDAPTPYKGVLGILVLLIVMVVVGSIYALVKSRSTRAPPSMPSSAPAGARAPVTPGPPRSPGSPGGPAPGGAPPPGQVR